VVVRVTGAPSISVRKGIAAPGPAPPDRAIDIRHPLTMTAGGPTTIGGLAMIAYPGIGMIDASAAVVAISLIARVVIVRLLSA